MLRFLILSYVTLAVGCCNFTQSSINKPEKSSAETSQITNAKPQLAQQSILDHTGIKALKSVLEQIVNTDTPNAQSAQHFFVARYGKNESRTYLYWREQRELRIIPLGGDTEASWAHIKNPSGGQLIDLEEDVVATEADVGSSTYLVSQPWVAQRIYDAVVNGDLIIVEHKNKTGE